MYQKHNRLLNHAAGENEVMMILHVKYSRPNPPTIFRVRNEYGETKRRNPGGRCALKFGDQNQARMIAVSQVGYARVERAEL